jgi:hypothetical protein
MPWHEFVYKSDLVVSDAGKNIGQPCLRVDAVQFGGFDQCIGDCSSLAAAY